MGQLPQAKGQQNKNEKQASTQQQQKSHTGTKGTDADMYKQTDRQTDRQADNQTMSFLFVDHVAALGMQEL